MDFQTIAQGLLPCWALGLFVIYTIRDSKYKNLLRIEFPPILQFLKFLLVVTAYRFIVLKFFTSSAMIEQTREACNFIPIGAVLGVPWEDLVHALPLVLLGNMFDKAKWYKWVRWPLLIAVMLSFGVGHLYQGPIAALMLSFYIPFSVQMGKKYGFGTVGLCHIMYDAVTLLSVRLIVGMM